VGRLLLAIDQVNSMFPAKADKRRQGDFGGIRRVAKHGFTKYRVADSNAVKPADQLIIDPGFNAMGMSGMVKFRVGMNHVGQYPCARLALAWCAGASGNDASEVGVKSDFATRIAPKSGQHLPK
jgi:hypothetical protein